MMEAIYVEVGGGASLEDIVEKIPPGEYDIAGWVMDTEECGMWQYGSSGREGFTTYVRLVCVAPDKGEEFDAIISALERAASAFGGHCGHCSLTTAPCVQLCTETLIPKRKASEMLASCKRMFIA